MNKWIMLLCAGLLVVMIGCGPKDPAADAGTGDEVTKTDADANKAEGDANATEEKKPEGAPLTSPMDGKAAEPVAPGDEKKPEDIKSGPATPEKTETTPETK